ncbi:MAG: recombinase family protein [Verrucomicrobiae bacterium]|nr:recombinase family protein [Verrucomicrobiae bacterium]
MEKAYGYIRVSGQGQVDGDGFRRQTDEIENYCKTAKIELVNVFEEKAISGTVDETQRPAFQEMIQAILKNGVKTVIVERMDRLAREYRIQETLLIYMASKGIQLINAGTGENVTEAISSDPMKKALIQMQGIFAELEKNLLVKKLRSAREAKRLKNGKCEGRKSYAESAPETLAKIKALYRKPRNGERKTLQEIADALNAEGILTLDGQQWSKANVHRVISAN